MGDAMEVDVAGTAAAASEPRSRARSQTHPPGSRSISSCPWKGTRRACPRCAFPPTGRVWRARRRTRRCASGASPTARAWRRSWATRKAAPSARGPRAGGTSSAPRTTRTCICGASTRRLDAAGERRRERRRSERRRSERRRSERRRRRLERSSATGIFRGVSARVRGAHRARLLRGPEPRGERVGLRVRGRDCAPVGRAPRHVHERASRALRSSHLRALLPRRNHGVLRLVRRLSQAVERRGGRVPADVPRRTVFRKRKENGRETRHPRRRRRRRVPGVRASPPWATCASRRTVRFC